MTSKDYQRLKGGIDKANIWHRRLGTKMYQQNRSRSKCPAFKILARFIHFLLVDALAFSRELMKKDGETEQDYLTQDEYLVLLMHELKQKTFTKHFADQRQ